MTETPRTDRHTNKTEETGNGWAGVGWRRSSSANKNSVLREEYWRKDQYLSIAIQPNRCRVHYFVQTWTSWWCRTARQTSFRWCVRAPTNRSAPGSGKKRNRLNPTIYAFIHGYRSIDPYLYIYVYVYITAHTGNWGSEFHSILGCYCPV